MGRIKTFIVYGLSFIVLCAHAQSDTSFHVKQEKFIAGNFKNFYGDNLGNIFLLMPNNRIKKINAAGDSVAVFNDVRRYGDIYSIDVSNPLKILIYYKDYSTLAILDRFMNMVNIIDLRKANILQASAAAQSADNNYWVFDALENKLKSVNDNGELLSETSDFRILFDDLFLPSKIIDDNRQLYLYDEKFGWMIFDYYGAFKQKYIAPGWNNVQVINNTLTGFCNDSIYEINPQSFTTKSSRYIGTFYKCSNCIKIEREFNFVYALKKDGLYIYSLLQ